MYDELTKEDIAKMQAELEDRIVNQRKVLLEEVKRCREFGDLSENFEYKEAKRAKNRNESRIRYLQNMIKTAKVIDDSSDADSVGLYDKVEIYIPEDDETQIIKVVTTIRINPLDGLISKESPLGKAVLGRKVGDKVTVCVSDTYSYEVEIKYIEKGEDDGSAPILTY
ncbi:MAG: GreA/GreB family elongation factor [Clostridia bacterium]|nr:GreA/GreB family elongation factor [Clostridia bacterium]